MGPQETQVVANVSENSGNIRTTLQMAFPCCHACSKRARFEKVRQILVGIVAAVLGVALAIGAWVVNVGAATAIRFAIALPVAAAVAAALAFLTRGSVPAAPATARAGKR